MNLGCNAAVPILMVVMCLVLRYQREAEAARRSAAEDKQRLEFQLASMRVCNLLPRNRRVHVGTEPPLMMLSGMTFRLLLCPWHSCVCYAV